MTSIRKAILLLVAIPAWRMTDAAKQAKSTGLIVRYGVVTAVGRRVTIRESDGAQSSCFFWHSTVGRRKALLGLHVKLTCIVSLNTPVAIKIEDDGRHAP